MKWIAVFVAMVTTDYFWARYTAHVSGFNPLRASWFSSLIVLCSAFTVMEYTSDWRMVIPAALGAAVGTYLAVKKQS